MSQQSVFKLLKKKKKWMTTKEIAKTLPLMSISASLQKLCKYGEVMRRKTKARTGKCYQYKIKD